MVDLHVPSLDEVKKLPPTWWGAIAAAGAAGATIFDGHRVLAGLGAAALMLFVALRVSGPCCADCAGQGGTVVPDGTRPDPRNTPTIGEPAPSTGTGGLDELGGGLSGCRGGCQ